MRARYYNVDIKRFINQDVVEGNITNSPSLNKYAYCQGNPVSILDPFGLFPQPNWSDIGACKQAEREFLAPTLNLMRIMPL